MNRKLAQMLLEIKAVELRPNDPFTWASGIKSPIYCDNRLTMSHPEVRSYAADLFKELIEQKFPDAGVIAGTATAGIPHAAWVSEKMGLPMNYIRSSAKKHGKGNQIEGKVLTAEKAVVIEDLISTGGSSLEAVQALQEAGVEVAGVVSLFTYGFKKAKDNFESAGVPYFSLTNFDTLIEEAVDGGYIEKISAESLREWKDQF
ncbi:orotate phosphoribosyltransferase [Jeotgalibacillus aurantiacus]|uniref:orotate phosphoribosyltransferase n=1 Tax=Jeotgalibacillus aurantiacus TaxID=2763266 RepID=UPI001D0AC344|nr:orotate phosphoribosyltransferase [Jeotgalibacillus aurantiacus]